MRFERAIADLEAIRHQPEDYHFSFEAHHGRVSIVFNGVTIADSTRPSRPPTYGSHRL